VIRAECDSVPRCIRASTASMCRLLQVSRSGYQAWLVRTPSVRNNSDAKLGTVIEGIFRTSHRRYGAPRVHAVLRQDGVRVGRKRVARLMRLGGLSGQLRARRRRVAVTKLVEPLGANVLARRFAPALQGGQDRKWVADFTYLATIEGWLYLAIVLDLASRRIVGWGTAKSLDQDVSITALRSAILTRHPASGLLHHADRGSQYVSNAYRELLHSCGASESWSKRGDCWDNAVAESFFATLKTELRSKSRRWQTRAAARAEIVEYLRWYNDERLHSSLGYETPTTYEQNMFKRAS
jgi:putative transposase